MGYSVSAKHVNTDEFMQKNEDEFLNRNTEAGQHLVDGKDEERSRRVIDYFLRSVIKRDQLIRADLENELRDLVQSGESSFFNFIYFSIFDIFQNLAILPLFLQILN